MEVFLERGDRLGVMAEQERVTSVSPAFVSGAGVRVFQGKDHGYRDGFVSTNDLSEAGLLQALDQALGMLGLERNGAAAAADFQGLPELKDYGTSKQGWLDQSPGVSVIAERLLEGTARLEQHAQHLQARRGSYSRDWQEVMVAASDGTFARDLRLHQTLGLSVLAADGEHRASVARRFGSTDHPDDLLVWDADSTARDIAASTGTMLYADYVDAGTYPVVLANKFGGVIFHEACGHLLENHPAGARHQPLCWTDRRAHRP